MNTETHKDMDKLERMKEDFSAIKANINEKEIIGQPLLRMFTEKRLKRYERQMRLNGMLFGPVIALSWLIIIRSYGFSWWLCGSFAIFIIVLGLSHISLHRVLKTTDFSQDPLKECCRKLLRYKRNTLKWRYATTAVLILFLIWMTVEAVFFIPEEHKSIVLTCVFTGLAFGLIAGFFVGRKQRIKDLKIIDDFLSQVQKLED